MTVNKYIGMFDNEQLVSLIILSIKEKSGIYIHCSRLLVKQKTISSHFTTQAKAKSVSCSWKPCFASHLRGKSAIVKFQVDSM